MLIDIHGEVYDHAEPCPDLNCCMCECGTCKRAWEAAGRPRSENCPKHGSKPATGPKKLTRWMMQDAARKVEWRGSKTDFVTDLLEELGLPEEFEALLPEGNAKP